MLQEHAPLSTWNVNQQQLQLQQPGGQLVPQGHVYYPGEMDENERRMQPDLRSTASGSQVDQRSLASSSQFAEEPSRLGKIGSFVSRTMQSIGNTATRAASSWAEMDNQKSLLSTHEIIAKLQEKRDFERQQELRKHETLRTLVNDSLGGPRTEMDQLPSGLTLQLQRTQIGPHPRDRKALAPMAKIRNRSRLYELDAMPGALHSQLLARPSSAVSQAESRNSSRFGSKSMSVFSDFTSVSRQWRPEPQNDIDGQSSCSKASRMDSRTTMGSRHRSSTLPAAGSTREEPMSPLSPISTSKMKRWNERDPKLFRSCTAHALRVS